MTDDGEIRHGTKLGRFVVTGELGRGGMGVVYMAHDPELDRQVALKVLRSAAATEEERLRMLREGQAMARITHPNVITVYEVGVAGDVVFLAQELLDGGTLRGWLESRRTRAEIIDKFVAAGRGLAAAHAAGLVHRDFKPDNVLLGSDGRLRVADFGLARALGTDEELAPETRANIARAQLELSTNPMSPLTRTGAVMGTPMFMAPEQHRGERADERSDQFGFCVALYHALHGAWPFAGKTSVALANAVIKGRFEPPPRGHGVPARLRAILARGLATDPAARYPSMDALLADLTRPPSRAGRRLALAAGALALTAGAVVGGYVLRTRGEPARPPLAAFDPKSVTSERGVTWLATALERGQLDTAIEKYAMAASLAQATAPREAAIARAAEALALVLRGRLDDARARLRDATGLANQDPLALAYADLASAALALAAGEPRQAQANAERCARGFATSAPRLAAMCFELHGDAAAARGEVAAAREAYASGVAAARRAAAGTPPSGSSSARAARRRRRRRDARRGRRGAARGRRRGRGDRHRGARVARARARARRARRDAAVVRGRRQRAAGRARGVRAADRAADRAGRGHGPARRSRRRLRQARRRARRGRAPRVRRARARGAVRARRGDGHADAPRGRRRARRVHRRRARPRLRAARAARRDHRDARAAVIRDLVAAMTYGSHAAPGAITRGVPAASVRRKQRSCALGGAVWNTASWPSSTPSSACWTTTTVAAPAARLPSTG